MLLGIVAVEEQEGNQIIIVNGSRIILLLHVWLQMRVGYELMLIWLSHYFASC